jgi:hypothetical protein
MIDIRIKIPAKVNEIEKTNAEILAHGKTPE